MPEHETRILLIRHGSVDNPGDISYGRLPIPLSKKGEEEVANLARVLRSQGVKIDAIYSSPVERAKQSALIIKEELGIDSFGIREDLTDVGIGKLEGAPMQIIRDVNYSEENLREMGFEIEPKGDIAQRMREVIGEVVEKHQGETIALLSHGDTTRLGLWSQENPEKAPPKDLRDEKYLAVGEAVILRFWGKSFLGYEFVRREGLMQTESDHVRRKEAY